MRGDGGEKCSWAWQRRPQDKIEENQRSFDHNTFPVNKAILDRYEVIKKWNGKCDNSSGIIVEKVRKTVEDVTSVNNRS